MRTSVIIHISQPFFDGIASSSERQLFSSSQDLSDQIDHTNKFIFIIIITIIIIRCKRDLHTHAKFCIIVMARARREFLREILDKNIAIIAIQHSKIYFVGTFGDFSYTVE